MAITINSSPLKYSPLNSVLWKASMDDLGTPPVRKDFGYYITDGAGTRLMPKDKKIIPTGIGIEFSKEFSSFCKGLVSTSFPSESSSPQVDSKIIKEIKLKYGEISFNSTSCVSTVNIGTSTSSVYVLNSLAQTTNISKFGNGTGFTSPRTGLLLSSRPDYWTTKQGTKDYLWFLGAGSISITYYNGSTTISTHNHSLTGATTVKYVSLDPLVYGVNGSLTSANVFISDGVDEWTYKIYYTPCRITSNDYSGILFLEPLGGMASIAIGEPERMEIDRSGSEISKPYSLLETMHKEGGKSFFSKNGIKKRSFQIEMEKANGVHEFIENFYSSPYHCLQRGSGATTVWEKYILDSGSLKVYDKNTLLVIDFSGYISEEIKTQQEGI